MDIELKEKQHVLLIWSGGQPSHDIENVVTHYKKVVGQEGNVSLEHADRLHMASHTASCFDVVLSGVLEGSAHVHTMELLTEIARILKLNGKVVLREPVGTAGGLRPAEKIVSSLKLSGFVDVSEVKEVKDSPSIAEVSCRKPNFEVGASSQLSFGSKPAQPKVDDNVAKIWTLSAQDIDDEEVELLDSETLLDEDDLKKPDPLSLKIDCGTGKSGKKKACKNCTCGFADEVNVDGSPATKKTVTSSCGSCYLGDAFRCSSCPYLGMPAFKPGDKIALTDRQLKGDIQ